MRTSGTGRPKTKPAASSRAQVGFTLIELLVVIVIIGITVGFVGPRIFGGIFASTMDRGTRDIANVIQLARSRAVKEHKTYFVRFDLDAEKVAVYRMVEEEGKEPALSSEISLPDGVDLREVKTPYQPEKDRGFLDLKVTPEGIVEQGVIYLEGPLGRVYTLVVKPFSGALKVHDHYVEVTLG